MTFRGAIISVGGSAEPIAKSLNAATPAFVLFVVSGGSKAEIEQRILPKLTYTPQYNSTLVTDESDFATSYQVVREAIPRWLEERRLEERDVYVDITGATKPMSAGLAMAAAEHFSHFMYVGGRERDKAGLGVVVSGSEEVFRTVNPWDTLATRERDRATWLFRSYYPQPAAEQLRQAAGKCSPELQQEIETLAELSDCFASVDRFHFRNAYGNYRKLRDRLNLTLSHRGLFSVFQSIEHLADHWRSVEEESESDGKRVSATLRELLANADRRAAQGRYDDAVARLYRASELFAQGRLYESFGARLGKMGRDQIPSEHIDHWVSTFGDRQNGVYVLGVREAFAALGFSRDPQHRAIAQRYEALHHHLQKRNSSILAHGLQPCTQEGCASLRSAVLVAVNVTEDEVPRWPELQF